ncbi:hypothetical protein BHM03_00049724 [Ensete ventricosum]|nr:hypothetical protein BHM03_00049724 [Ensete ventricosum]
MTSDGFSSAQIHTSLQTRCVGLASGGESDGRRMVDVGGSVEHRYDGRKGEGRSSLGSHCRLHRVVVVTDPTTSGMGAGEYRCHCQGCTATRGQESGCEGLTTVDFSDNVGLAEKEQTILLEPQVMQCDNYEGKSRFD